MQITQSTQNLDTENESGWHNLSPQWQWCMEEAWASYCKGSLPIGAVVTDEQGKLLARGRNRIYENDICENDTEDQILRGHRLAHAEMNALINVNWEKVNPHKCTLYTTTEPCPLCVGAIRLTRIRTVRYASRDEGAGSADLFDANKFMQRGKIRVVGPEHADLEIILVAMLVDVVLRRDEKNMSLLYEPVAEKHPFGAELGKYLFTTGKLDLWNKEGSPIKYVFAQLMQFLRSTAS